jgi:hypothetical protein
MFATKELLSVFLLLSLVLSDWTRAQESFHIHSCIHTFPSGNRYDISGAINQYHDYSAIDTDVPHNKYFIQPCIATIMSCNNPTPVCQVDVKGINHSCGNLNEAY